MVTVPTFTIDWTHDARAASRDASCLAPTVRRAPPHARREFYYVHPALPNKAFPRRKAAAEAALAFSA